MSEILIAFAVGVASSLAAWYLALFVLERFLGRVRFRTILDSVDKLAMLLAKVDFIPDYIVGVGRNGAIVASILSGQLGLRTIMTASLQTHWTATRRETILETSYMPRPEALRGKKLLLVTCFVNTGAAMIAAYDHYSHLDPEAMPAEIRTASIFTAPDPILKPDFYVIETERTTGLPMRKIMRRLPWMRAHWQNSLDESKARAEDDITGRYHRHDDSYRPTT